MYLASILDEVRNHGFVGASRVRSAFFLLDDGRYGGRIIECIREAIWETHGPLLTPPHTPSFSPDSMGPDEHDVVIVPA